MAQNSGIARSVRIFLPDGTPNGLMTAEIMNWSGKVIAAPRTRLSELVQRPEASKTGVYIMTGPDPDRLEGTKVYIGEADNVGSRLRRHDGVEAMDFFNRAAMVVSSDENLTKAHVRVLESMLLQHATQAQRCRLANETSPSFARLPEADLADMAYFVEQLLLVLPIAGFDIFRPGPTSRQHEVAQSGQPPRFEFEALGAHARGFEADEGFIVLAGSTIRKDTTATIQTGYRDRREQLLRDGVLAPGPDPDRYVLASDVTFPSPTAAASVVAGRSASGPLEWKLAGTKITYREWRSQQLK